MSPVRFVQRHRHSARGSQPGEVEDPLAGAANLFDVSVVFIVALLIALFTLFSASELLNPESSMTILQYRADGTMEIISKEFEEIKVQRVTDQTLSGQGVRLGVAYELANGQVVYVPERIDPDPEEAR